MVDWDRIGYWVLAGLACLYLHSASETARSARSSEDAEWGNPARADFRRERPSRDTRELADWIAGSRDNHRQPFAIVDKQRARLFVFNRSAQLLGTTPVLLGAARGDDSVPGIGARAIADILPRERTTPAGRFQAEHGRNLQGEDIVWVDYDAGVSMHRVRANVPEERRLERLASPSVLDNRISFGCINVPKEFFESVIDTAFSGSRFVVYILPETRPWRAVFAPVPATPGKAVAGTAPTHLAARGSSVR